MLVGNVCLKNLIARPRPCWLDSSVRLLIAFSRLYLYVHFPSDVLAAAVPGVMIGELAFYADRRWTERKGT